MRGGGAPARARAPGLDHDHRLVASRRARRAHELARNLDRLDVQQDRPRLGIAGEEVQKIAKIHVGLLAQRDEMRKADVAGARPVQHRRHQRAGLRNEGQFAGSGIQVRETRIEADMRRQRADAVRPQHTQQIRPRRIQHRLLLRRVQPGADHDRRTRAARTELRNQSRHRRRRRTHHRQFRHLRKGIHARVDRFAVEFAVFRIQRVARPGIAAVAQIAPHRGAHAAGPRRGADHRHRGRIEQGIEIAYRHDRFRKAGNTGEARSG